MTVRRLRFFEAVGRHLNLTKAARELGVTQPCVSKQLSLLEKECGTKLYLAMRQGIKLTDEGRDLLTAARPALRSMEAIEERFVGGGGNSRGQSLRIGGSESCSAALLPKAISAFREAYPNVRIVLLTSDSKTVEKNLLNSDIEIALLTESSDNPTVVVEPFRSEQVVAVASAGCPLPENRRFMLKELSESPFLKKQDGRITQQLERAGIRLNFVLECQSHNAVKSAAESGLGIAFFAYDEVAEDLNRGSLKRIDIAELRELDFRRFIVYRKGEPLSREAQNFIGMLHRDSYKRSRRIDNPAPRRQTEALKRPTA
jgi:DNA-binding transcriptional LysR family regulator